MKIVISKDEAVTYDIFLHSIDPRLETAFHKMVEKDPTMNMEILDSGEVAYEVDEELVIEMANCAIEGMPVIVPMCKGLYAAVKATCFKLNGTIHELYAKAMERQKAAEKAAEDMNKAARDMDDARRRLCIAAHPDCAKKHNCKLDGCGKRAED